MFKMSQSLVTGAKEKLAANFTLFLGCFLAGLSTGPLLSWDSGVSEGGQGGAGTQEELESEVNFLLFTGSVFSSWFKIIISVNTEKQTFSSKTCKYWFLVSLSSFHKKYIEKITPQISHPCHHLHTSCVANIICHS